MTFRNLKISTILAMGFGIMSLLIALMGTTALIQMRAVDQAFKAVTETNMPRVAAIHDVKDKVYQIGLSLRNLLLLSDKAQREPHVKQIFSIRWDIGEALDRLRKQIDTDQGRALMARMDDIRGNYVQGQVRVMSLVDEGRSDEARAYLMESLRPIQLRYFEAMDAMVRYQIEQLQASQGRADGAMHAIEVTVWAVGLVSLVAALLAALWAIRRITGPLNEAVRVSHAVASGDLTLQLGESARNETGQLMAALKQMLGNLGRLVSNTRRGADSLATASAQIAQGNQALSARTEEQASALEETAAAMEQLNATVQQNADNARQASQLASHASVVALKGGDVVTQVVQTMREINDGSHRISNIIGVIDGIAFQTNILALNAAVEAARAGEQGRGFAVVAQEVRSLAGRSAEAAREVRSLIHTSVERVERGSVLVDQAGATMMELVTAVRRVTDLMAEISAASQEQSLGVSQVGEAVHQMERATQHNAALVEEMAAAASSLQGQADALVATVSVFRLADKPGEVVTVTTPNPPPGANREPRLALPRPRPRAFA